MRSLEPQVAADAAVAGPQRPAAGGRTTTPVRNRRSASSGTPTYRPSDACGSRRRAGPSRRRRSGTARSGARQTPTNSALCWVAQSDRGQRLDRPGRSSAGLLAAQPQRRVGRFERVPQAAGAEHHCGRCLDGGHLVRSQRNQRAPPPRPARRAAPRPSHSRPVRQSSPTNAGGPGVAVGVGRPQLGRPLRRRRPLRAAGNVPDVHGLDPVRAAQSTGVVAPPG